MHCKKSTADGAKKKKFAGGTVKRYKFGPRVQLWTIEGKKVQIALKSQKKSSILRARARKLGIIP